MEQDFNEQIGNDTHTAAAENTKGDDVKPISLKKFKDVDALLKAYESLEAEFTKRSQRLRLLEGERTEKTAQPPERDAEGGAEKAGAGDEAEFIKRHPAAKDKMAAIAAAADGNGAKGLESAYIDVLEGELKRQAETFSSKEYVLSQIDSTIKDSVIRDFLSEIASAKPTFTVGGGQATLTPPIRPNTIDEAGRLAEKLFR